MFGKFPDRISQGVIRRNFSGGALFTGENVRKSVRTELTFGMDCWIRVQDYKSLRSAVMICATLVNTRTHTRTHTDGQAAVGRLYTMSLPTVLKTKSLLQCIPAKKLMEKMATNFINHHVKP